MITPIQMQFWVFTTSFGYAWCPDLRHAAIGLTVGAGISFLCSVIAEMKL